MNRCQAPVGQRISRPDLTWRFLTWRLVQTTDLWWENFSIYAHTKRIEICNKKKPAKTLKKAG